MTAMQSWCFIIGISTKQLTKEENFLLEGEIFFYVMTSIKESFKQKYKRFFSLMKYNMEMENTMIENDYLRLIIHDIIATEEYDIKGIAYYTDTPEEILLEILTGTNKNPSAVFMQRLIELHRLVRRELYQRVLQKLVNEHLLAA